jgi:SPP1 gp7 family putative phage head morphogenesis protein
MIEKAMLRAYQRKTSAKHPDVELWKANADTLWNGVKEGLPKDFNKLDFGSSEHRMALNLRHNVFVTAAFKVHHNQLEMAKALFDENGKPRSFAQFKKAVKGINADYNKKYLQAEYQTAVASARGAATWQRFEAKGVEMLTYRTQGDGRVRDEHAVLNGITKPLKDDFWLSYYPPNGWRCRCFVREADEGAETTDTSKIAYPELKEGFKNNPGITGQVFTKDLPYFDVEKGFQSIADRVFDLPNVPISPEDLKRNVELFKEYQDNKDYSLEFIDNLSGGFVFKHVKADLTDLEENLFVGTRLANNGNAVAIRPHYKKGDPKLNNKNPEYILNGVVTDLKTPDKLTSIGTGFSNVQKGLKSLVCYLKLNHSYDDMIEGIHNGFFFNKHIEKVTIVKNNTVVEIIRNQWRDGSYKNILKRL